MDDGIQSNRRLAALIGVSEAAIRKAEKSGRIRRREDGKWDPHAVRAQMRANGQLTKGGLLELDEMADIELDGELGAVPSSDVHDVAASARAMGIINDGAGLTLLQVKVAREVQLWARDRMAMDVRRGELVDRKKMETLFAKLAVSIREQWQSWPADIAAELADKLKVQPAVLSAHLAEAVNAQLMKIADATQHIAEQLAGPADVAES